MLSFLIFLPLAAGLAVLALPARWERATKPVGLLASFATLGLSLLAWLTYDLSGPRLQWRTTADWIPSVGARYDVAVDGFSLPLLALTAGLFCLAFVFTWREEEKGKAHGFLLLLMETGLLGVFCAQDLLLFYLFFEIALVPMYFIVGIWGGGERRYAALKFFLYTRAGSLAMLLAFLGLYLSMAPHTFSLPAIAAAHPLAARPMASTAVFFGLLLGFGVKLPVWPIHNWLPDAHVEAPTEGSVILAGLQLKMGGYGILRVLLPAVPEAAERFQPLIVTLALISLLWGILAALAQSDFKRLVAYTSINHMAFVLLGAGVWAGTTDAAVRTLALNGAALQLVSHGLLTGGMFFVAGILQHGGTRDLARLGGLLGSLPKLSLVLGLLAFGSIGLPGLSGFIAEFQVLGATVAVSRTAAAVVVLGLVVTTGVYLHVIGRVVLGTSPPGTAELAPPPARAMVAAGAPALLSLVIGLVPSSIVPLIETAARALAF